MLKPVSWNRVRDSELVGMTLIEVLLVFVFAFLLVLNLFYRDKQVAEDSLTEIHIIASDIHTRLEALGLDQKEEYQVAEDSLAASTLAELRDIKEVFDRLGEATSFDQPEIWAVVQRHGGVSNIIKMLEIAEADASQSNRKNAVLTQKLVEAGVDVPEGDYGGEGDKPGNCWYADPILKKGDQYLLHVAILEDRLVVKRAWPDQREGDLQTLPVEDLIAAVPSEMSYARFMSLANNIFEYSKTQKCRFYVRANDQARSKTGFQDGLRAIGERFYYLAENF